MLFGIYEIEYPDEGHIIIEAESEDEAKQKYNEHTGTPMEFDMLGIFDVCQSCGQAILPDED